MFTVMEFFPPCPPLVWGRLVAVGPVAVARGLRGVRTEARARLGAGAPIDDARVTK